MERKEPGIICCGKGFLSGPLFRFAMRSFMFALQLAAVSPPLYSQSATELGSEGDLVVLGTGGTALDPNVKIKGFTVFGSTQPAYTGAVTGNGNVVINGVLAVSSGAYFVGNSTFTGANKIFVNDGSPGQILGKNTGGWLEWFNAGAIGDDLGNHTAVQDLLMAGFSIVNAASGTFTQGITASSFTAAGVGLMAAQLRLNPANNLVISSETSAALGAGVRVSTNIYIVGFSSAAKYYGDGASLTGVVSAEALGSKIGGSGTADWVAKFQGSGNAITESSIYDDGAVVVFTNASSSVTVYGKDAASGYSLALSSGINMPNGTVNAGQVRFNPNIAVSSEPAAAYGGGVRVSTNVYIVGFSSAAKYYGDGSSLTGIAGDNLGNHNATQRLNMAGNQIVGVSSLTVIAPDTLASSLWVSTSVTTPHLYVSTNGKVGINTASPQSLFQAGEAGGAAYNLPGVAIIGDNASNALGIVGSSSLTNINLFISGLPNRTAVLQSQLAGTDGGTLDFWTKPDGGGLADRMRIDQDGNIGIGTTSPGARLEVAGGSATFRGSDANAAIVGFADAGGNYRVMISTSGNVGVGTIAPEYSLDVNGDVRFSGSKVVLPDSINLFSTTNPRIGWGAGGVRGISYIYLRPDNVTSSTTTEIATGSSANTLKIGAGVNVRGGMIDFVGGDAASNPGSLIFRTGTVFNAVDSPERARIDSAGNVGISTGAPQARLDVLAGGAAATDMATIWRNSAGTIVSSVSATGVMMAAKFIGDGSGITGLTGTGDNLGNHVATTTLNMSSKDIVSVSTISVSSITTAGAGVIFSTHVYFVNGNVGIGTTVPDRNLTVNAGNTNTVGLDVLGYNNTGQSGVYLQNSLNNGMFLSLTNSAGTTTHLFRSYGDSYVNTGNVGIGTTGPGRLLHLEAADNPVLRITSVADVTGYLLASSNDYLALISDTGGIRLGYGSPESFTAGLIMDGLGNVGIGTTAPGAKLHAVETSGSNNYIFVASTATDLGSYKMVVSTTGNIGVGTTNPSYGLEVVNPAGAHLSTTSTAGYGLYLNPDGNVVTGGSLRIVPGGQITTGSSESKISIFAGATARGGQIDFHGGGVDTNLDKGGALVFRAGRGWDGSGVPQPERMRIDYIGNVGLSTGAPQARLDVLAGGSTPDDMAQIWRKGDGVIVGSMSATGVMMAAKFIGDGSGITGLTGTGDNLGNHVATTTLNMSSKDIVSVSTISVSSITTAGVGVIFSTHVYFMNGNVGIGTTGPVYKLEVAGPAYVGANAGTNIDFANAGLIVKGTTSGNNSYIVLEQQGVVNWRIANRATSGNLDFLAGPAGSEKVTITTVGNVGIGTTSPGTRLEVAGGSVTIRGSDSNPAIAGFTDAGGNYRMVVSTNGNVGIGTVAPDSLLNVYGSYPTITVKGNSTYSSKVNLQGNDGDWHLENQYVNGSETNIFRIYNSALTSNAVTILRNSNNVGIGTANPGNLLHLRKTTGDGELMIEGGQPESTAGDAAVYLKSAVNWSSGNGLAAIKGITTSPNKSDLALFYGSAAGLITEGLRITNSGNVGISTNTPEGRLDVKAGGSTPADMAQIWRKSDGVIVGSMSATGVMMAAKFIGDGSGLSGITGAADDLGNHVATTTLNMSSKDIVSVSTISVSSITTAGAGVVFSTHAYFVNGNVGIGTTSPVSLFSLSASVANSGNGTVRLTRSGTDKENFIRFDTAQAASGSWLVGTDDSTGNSSNLAFFPSLGSSVLDITTAGNVGIGTTGPGGKLEVLKDSTYSNEYAGGLSLLSAASDSKLVMGADGTNNISYIQSLSQGGAWTDRALVLQPNGGNVGIGTTNPGAKLHVAEAAAGAANIRASGPSSDNNWAGGIELLSNDGTNVNAKINASVNGLFLSLAGSERLTIKGGGNVGIGTTEPAATLHVSSLTNTNLILESTTTAGSTVGLKFITNFGGTPVTASITNSWTGPGMVFTAPRDIIQTGFHFKAQSGVETMHIETQNNGVAIGTYADQTTPTPSNGLIVSGNVGIGTTTPSGKLHVAGGSSDKVIIAINAGVLPPTTNGSLNVWNNAVPTSTVAVFGFSDGSGNYRGGFLFTDIASPGDWVVPRMDMVQSYGGASEIRSLLMDEDASWGGMKFTAQKYDGAALAASPAFLWNNANSELMRISANGNVGIGTTSPGALLHASSSANTRLIMSDNNAPNANKNAIINSDSGLFTFGFASDDLSTTLHALAVKADGHIGIGTTTPLNSQLVIKTAAVTSADSALDVQNGTGINMLFVRADGNVGIGTAAPTTKLQVSVADASIGAVTGGAAVYATDAQDVDRGGKLMLGGVATGFANGFPHAGIKGAAENATASNYAGYLSMFTTTSGGSQTERMRINSAGNVGIGTTNPSAGFQVEKYAAGAYTAYISTSSTAGQYSIAVSSAGITNINNLVIENRTSDPASPVTGQIWLRVD